MTRRALLSATLLAVILTRSAMAATIAIIAGSIDVFSAPVTFAPAIATVDIKPETFEIRGTGVPVTVFIELPEPWRPASIVPASMRLCQGIDPCVDGAPIEGRPKVGDVDGDGVPELKVTFGRVAVAAVIGPVQAPTTVTLAVSGLMDGEHFVGSDTLRVVPR